MQFCFFLISFISFVPLAEYFLHLSTYSTTSMLIFRETKRVLFETQGDNMASCRSFRSHEHAFLSAMLDAAEAQNFQCPVCLNEFPPTERSLAGRSFWEVFRYSFCPCDKLLLKKRMEHQSWSHVRMSRIEGAMLAACAHLFCLGCADTLVRTSENEWSHDIPRRFFTFSIWKKTWSSVITIWAAWKFEASNQRCIATRVLTLGTICKGVQPHDINHNFERFLTWEIWQTHCTKWTWTFFRFRFAHNFEYHQIVDRMQSKQPATSPPKYLQKVSTASSWNFNLRCHAMAPPKDVDFQWGDGHLLKEVFRCIDGV